MTMRIHYNADNGWQYAILQPGEAPIDAVVRSINRREPRGRFVYTYRPNGVYGRSLTDYDVAHYTATIVWPSRRPQNGYYIDREIGIDIRRTER